MDNRSVSAIFGLMLIIIIIETTSLISAFPPLATNNSSVPVAQFPIVTAAPLAQQVFEADSVLPATDQADLTTADTIASNNPDNSTVVPVPTPAPVPTYPPPLPTMAPTVPSDTAMHVQYSDPLPDGDGNVSDFWHAGVQPQATLPPQDFMEIFNQSQSYEYNTTAISYTLKNPPMKIFFSVSPENQTDMKWIPNHDINKPTDDDGKIINVTRIDPESWFKVAVFDKTTSPTVIEKDGFGGLYGQDLDKEIIIREAGTYQIQMSGGYIAANVSILVPTDGNT